LQFEEYLTRKTTINVRDEDIKIIKKAGEIYGDT
jgi:hypothetical protein